MLDIQQQIDKNAYPDNYKALLTELQGRQEELARLMHIQKEQEQAKDELRSKSCSPWRVAVILLAGVPVSLPIALSVESPEPTASDQWAIVVLSLLFGLPLLHSIVTGRTLTRSGMVSLNTDAFSFTVMQLFYSYLLGLTLLLYFL